MKNYNYLAWAKTFLGNVVFNYIFLMRIHVVESTAIFFVYTNYKYVFQKLLNQKECVQRKFENSIYYYSPS